MGQIDICEKRGTVLWSENITVLLIKRGIKSTTRRVERKQQVKSISLELEMKELIYLRKKRDTCECERVCARVYAGSAQRHESPVRLFSVLLCKTRTSSALITYCTCWGLRKIIYSAFRELTSQLRNQYDNYERTRSAKCRKLCSTDSHFTDFFFSCQSNGRTNTVYCRGVQITHNTCIGRSIKV